MEAPFDNLSRVLARLPGLGRKSSERAALALVRRRGSLLSDLMEALNEARDSVCTCSVCGGITVIDSDPCRICRDERRDKSVLCVVEEPGDILAMERAAFFEGRYHALLGKMSAARATEPADLRLQALLDRLDKEPVREVILALSTDLEGDATSSYIREMLLARKDIKVTRLAFGLPVDSGVGYSDPVTLKRALSGRQQA